MTPLPLSLVIAMLLGVTTSDPQPTFGAAAELAALAQKPAAETIAAARRALDAHDYDRAAALAALASARTPDDAQAAMIVGLARFRDHEPERAVAPFARALAIAPDSATLRFNLASALYQSGHFAAAEARYDEVAARDDKLRPLALLDAGLAALDGGAPDRAAQKLAAAEKAARAAGQDPVAAEAHATLHTLARRSHAGASEELRRLAHAGALAVRAHRYDEGAADYRRASAVAEAEGAAPVDRAEIEYGLGHALWRAGDLVGAARALAGAIALSPDDAEFHYLLGLVHFDAGADADAKLALERAVALGLPDDEANRAADVLHALLRTHRSETSRLFVEVRAAGGYDTNVPQSGVLLTAAQGKGAPTDAPLLEADLDFFWRPAGTARNGFSLEYRFGELAYVSETLDPYSIQEHDLTVSGAWTPTPRLTLELGASGFALFSGVQTFGPFQAGGSVGPRVSLREPHGLETRVRYLHILKQSLDLTYDYLGGQRDEAGIAEAWRNTQLRVALGYLFAREAIGVQKVTLGQLDLPVAPLGSYDPNDVYFIPYSYTSHEISLALIAELPRDFHGSAMLRYEHRDYPDASHIAAPNGIQSYYRVRRDNRFAADIAVRHPIAAGFDIELAYTFIVNRSTIDNTRASTALDYDDKSYFKHVVQLGFGYVY